MAVGRFKLTVLLVLISTRITLSANIRRLFQIVTNTEGNSAQTLWDQYRGTGYNNPTGDKGDMTIYEACYLGDFQAIVDPEDPPDKICLEAYGTTDMLIGSCFNTSGADITLFENWFTTNRLLNVYPHDLSKGTVNVTVSSGLLEVMITDSTDINTVWFTLLYDVGPTDPTIMVTSNLTAGLVIHGEIIYEGCYAYVYLDRQYMFTDDADMTVEACFVVCQQTDFLYVAMQWDSAFKCHCANYSGVSPVAQEAFCTSPCPGHPADTCGGPNNGYYSLYSENSTIDVPSGPSTQTPILEIIMESSVFLNYSLSMADYLSQSFLFANAISVLALDRDSKKVNFTYDWSRQRNTTGFNTTCQEYTPSKTYLGDGLAIDIDLTVMRHFCVYFESEVESFNITLYGPSGDSYVTGEFIVIYGKWEIPESSCSVIAASTSSLSVAMSTSTPVMTSTLVVTSTTMVTVTISEPLSPSSSDGMCYYSCPSSTASNITNSQIVEQIVANLTVKKETLSSHVRRYTSARDTRASATTIGSLGIITISLTIGLLVYLDTPRLITEMSKLKKNFQIARKEIKKLYRERQYSTEVIEFNTPTLPSVLSIYEPEMTISEPEMPVDEPEDYEKS